MYPPRKVIHVCVKKFHYKSHPSWVYNILHQVLRLLFVNYRTVWSPIINLFFFANLHLYKEENNKLYVEFPPMINACTIGENIVHIS